MREPETVEEILVYWASKGIYIELIADGYKGAKEFGCSWRPYAFDHQGNELDGDGDMGCHPDLNYILKVTHYQLKERQDKQNKFK